MMMQASSVAEATARAVVAAVGQAATRAAEQGAGHRGSGRLGRSSDPARTRAARAGPMPSSGRSAWR